ncbi:MAG: geranylgeranylglycerol-phosphate geranylgeranyltransferase [candidate division Zixibacteria bacterium]|nr:geranylgeranylglycerol-phosphate geranylgeranyltransferase [candidate division Zixibacteria bacterium]MDH3937874.1 geranylgeranylglycerol-phosphate geranylgeranyltransferase [candidate division Zixibacteria bacterium]
MRKLIETLRLIRVINCIMAMLGVGLGAHLVEASVAYYGPAMAALCAAFVCAAGNIVNDLVDIDIDRINRPQRVLVRQALSRRYAITLAVILNLAALAVALTVSMAVALIGLVAIGLLMAYNFKLKRVTFLGNVIISILGGMTFLTGGMAVDTAAAFGLPGPLIPALFAFIFHLVREIVKDVQDIEGDRRLEVRTLPQLVGVRRSLWLAWGFFMLLAVLTLVPILLDWFGGWYKLITVFIMDLPLGALLFLLCLRPTDGMLQTVSWALKAGMVVGIVAIWVA